MIGSTVVSLPPVARDEYLERFELLPEREDLPEAFWTEVDDAIQSELASIDDAVAEMLPAARVARGRTRGTVFFLFSYRTYSLPGSPVDPVVVGITVLPAEAGMSVSAGVSGEQTGDIVRELPDEIVPFRRRETMAQAAQPRKSFAVPHRQSSPRADAWPMMGYQRYGRYLGGHLGAAIGRHAIVVAARIDAAVRSGEHPVLQTRGASWLRHACASRSSNAHQLQHWQSQWHPETAPHAPRFSSRRPRRIRLHRHRQRAGRTDGRQHVGPRRP